MHAVFPLQQSQPLFGTGATRRIESRALATSDTHALMRAAGLATARLALAVAPHARRVWVAAGPGNNGGDGLEAALHLQQWGKEVIVTHAAAATLPADAADALARARSAGVTIEAGSARPQLGPEDIAIDALLGLGASRAPEGLLAETVQALNALPCTVIAIDLPSGLSGDTGQPLGTACVIAHHTLALLTLKPGLFTAAGRDHAGRVWLEGLGVDLAQEAPDAWLTGHTDAPPARRHAQHKGSFGDVAVVGGAPGFVGAAILAARAADAAGCGRVFVDLLGAGRAPGAGVGLDLLRPELMFRTDWWQSAPELVAASTVVCGCGGGDLVRQALPRLLARAGRLVLDADALNAIAADASLQDALRRRGARGSASVLTPHPLEAARLLACTTAEVQADRLHQAQRLADRFGCVVVLKGSGSVIAAPGRVPHVNATGNAALASAGTGDVLAGWLGGIWSQAGGEALSTAFDTATRAVAMHGAAAEPLRPGALRAADLVEALHRRLRGA